MTFQYHIDFNFFLVTVCGTSLTRSKAEEPSSKKESGVIFGIE